jgi:hypothetical protein
MNSVDVYRDEKYRALIKHLPCVRCWVRDGTIVPAHYFGPRRHMLGGGMGHKVTDAAIAALCLRCHTHMDTYQDGNTWERSEEFLFLVVLTHHMLLRQGLLVPSEGTP